MGDPYLCTRCAIIHWVCKLLLTVYLRDFEYCSFYDSYSEKKAKFEWTSACQRVFNLLKERFTTAPILAHFNYKKCIVETNASNNVSAGVLSQYSDNNKLYLVVFFSQKHSPQETNYKIYDKKLLAIIKTFEKWQPMLKKAGLLIKILTDHWNLQYFMTTKQLSCCQAC